MTSSLLASSSFFWAACPRQDLACFTRQELTVPLSLAQGRKVFSLHGALYSCASVTFAILGLDPPLGGVSNHFGKEVPENFLVRCKDFHLTGWEVNLCNSRRKYCGVVNDRKAL